ncbi:hypothetical protein WJX75_007060 [Coccomyxa subellipsoidea]|uniref:OTU domain-containing protein n=1 Tax=Coccomyxa subellipsoidea TaxID=248742 RepID=A0ABR2YFD4_9CHLO
MSVAALCSSSSSSAKARGTSAESPARNSAVGDTSSSGVGGAPVQFEIHRIAGDGSCLFRAVAQGAHHTSTGALLSGRELFEEGFGLRREVCAEMVRRREEIEPFIPGLFDAYVSNMSLEGIWGGEPELAVAIHCIQRPIIVYKEVKSGIFGKDLEKVSEYGAQEYPGVSPVMQDAVTEAVQAAVDEGMKFDVRANLYTIIAITGVVLYWRGIWTTWDYFFGFTIWSELGAILTGLGIMIAFRLFKMPLLDGLPSG